MALPRRLDGPEGPRVAQIRRSLSRNARRRLGPLCAGVVALLAVPAVAAGQSIAITPPSDMVADKIQTVAVSGDAGPSGSRVYLHATTAASCAATYDQGADQAQVFSNGNFFSNSFSQNMQVSPYGAGPLLLCAYLTALPSLTPSATAQTTVAVREPSGSMQLAVEPNPPIQEQQYKITVSGTAERDTTAVRVISLDNGQACAATPDANGNGLQVHDLTGNGNNGQPTSGHPFSVIVRDMPFYARPERWCAYLVPFGGTHVDAFAQLLVTVGRFATSLSVEGDSSPYFIGEDRGLTLHGFAQTASDRFDGVVWDAACPPSPGGLFGGTFFSGAFDEPVHLRTTAAAATSFCAWIVHNGDVYASAQAQLTQVALPAPTPADGSPQGVVADRRPPFRWSVAPARSADTFLLSDGDAQPLLYADAKGSYLPADPDDPDSFDPGTGLRLDSDTHQIDTSQPKRERTDAAAWAAPAGVTPARALPPGRYSWTVTRDRFDGARRALGPVKFRILGPPLRILRVRARSIRHSRSAAPGFTRMVVTSTPYVSVRLDLRRGGRTRTVFLHWGARPAGSIDVQWSCKRTAGNYRYTLTARDDRDSTMSRHGVIRPISRSGCRALKAAEKRARDRRAEQRRLRQQAADRRRRAAERADLARQTRNCHKLDGDVRTLELPGGGTTAVCVTPYGIYPLSSP